MAKTNRDWTSHEWESIQACFKTGQDALKNHTRPCPSIESVLPVSDDVELLRQCSIAFQAGGLGADAFERVYV
jgi:hypothetical protein